MKKKRLTFLLLSVALLLHGRVLAATYQSVSSFQFSDPMTWAGGVVPPTTLTGADTIIINAGTNVNFDLDIKFTNAAGYLDIRGYTYGRANIEIAPGMRFSITGRAMMNNFMLGNGGQGYISAGYVYFNNIYVQDFTFTGTSEFHTAELHLRGNLVSSGARLFVGRSLHMLGGTLAGIDTLRSGFSHVRYAEEGYKYIAGQELLVHSLRYLTVDLPGNETIKMSSDVYITGVLSLTQGYLDLNGHNLTLNYEGVVANTGVGAISCSSPSKINLASDIGPVGTLWFKDGSSVSELIFTPTHASVARIGTPLLVTDSITLYNGKLELLKNTTLSLAPGATVFGATDNSYIITGNEGKLSAHIGANSSFTYPIGNKYYYMPITVTSKNGTAYSNVKASVSSGIKTMATYGRDLALNQPSVNNTWLLEYDGTADVDVAVAWNKGMEMGLFKRNIAYLSNFKVHYWDKTAGTPATAGPHANMYTQKGSFTSLGHFAVFDDNAVSVNNIASEVSAQVYPNPVADVLNVQCDAAAQAVVYNLAGQAMMNADVKSGSNSLGITSLPAGMYYLQLIGERMNGIVKFVKQ